MAGAETVLQRLQFIFLGCLLLQLTEYIPVASAEGHCIWYGQCTKPSELYKRNCFYNGAPHPIEDSARDTLLKYCPEIVTGGVSCCNSEQVRSFASGMLIPEQILSKSPSCFKNFLKHICAMTCAPNQSTFLKPVLENFNETHKRVKEIDYHLSNSYKKATYDFCVQVQYPPTNESVMNLMCGEYGAANCTTDRWFEFMGDATVPFVPFQINYVSGDEALDGFIPANPPITVYNVGLPATKL